MLSFNKRGTLSRSFALPPPRSPPLLLYPVTILQQAQSVSLDDLSLHHVISAKASATHRKEQEHARPKQQQRSGKGKPGPARTRCLNSASRNISSQLILTAIRSKPQKSACRCSIPCKQVGAEWSEWKMDREGGFSKSRNRQLILVWKANLFILCTSTRLRASFGPDQHTQEDSSDHAQVDEDDEVWCPDCKRWTDCLFADYHTTMKTVSCQPNMYTEMFADRSD
eukprot:699929-Hanusia_phi.AAC.3